MRFVTLGGYIGTLYLLFDALMKGEISVGAFAAVFSSIDRLYSIMEEIICGHIAHIAQNLGTVQNFLNFLDIKTSEGKDMDIPENSDIHVRNVSFTYSNAVKKAVDNVSFTIKNRETVAIVGENGSGKTTLIRLITGLYLPDSGNVFIGDVNTKDGSMKSLFSKTSAVFQKYQRYQLTLRDNIQNS